MSNELLEIIENKEEWKKQALLECEEIEKVVAEFEEIMKAASDKLVEFSSVTLRNTEIYTEKYNDKDRAPLLRVPAIDVIQRNIIKLQNSKNELWKAIENGIILQYLERGFPLVPPNGSPYTARAKGNILTIKGGNQVVYKFDDGPEKYMIIPLYESVQDFVDKEYKKPPLGIIPKYIKTEERIEELKQGVERHVKANLPVPKKWSEELQELVDNL